MVAGAAAGLRQKFGGPAPREDSHQLHLQGEWGNQGMKRQEGCLGRQSQAGPGHDKTTPSRGSL